MIDSEKEGEREREKRSTALRVLKDSISSCSGPIFGHANANLSVFTDRI